jgi:hypothetical protein|tara:strand:+ start:1945 stop:3561 length:1617 start_codon:yes stop_codon:yes gene_type:complete
MSLPYKYTTKFDNIVLASSEVGDANISKASLESLRPLIPKNIDLEKNIDLLAVAFNAAVVNKFNKNGDGIDSETAVAVKDYFVHKPTNIEHDRDKIVGHIVSAGFSKYGNSSELMDDDAALIEDQAYNIALAAVIYRTASKEFAELVENSTSEDSDYYQSVSASWEVGFNDYVISVGGDDLYESSIISDPEEIQVYSSYLKSLGGKGELKDGRKVNRLIVGDIYPLGIGFTSNPAADVKGLIAEQNNRAPEKPSRNEPIDKIIIKSKKTSHSSQENVLNKEPNNTIMDKDQIINDFRAALDEKLGKQDFSEESVASISKVFIEAIREKGEQYVADLEKAKAEKEEAVQAQNSLQEKMTEVEDQLNSTKEKLAALEQENSAREAEVRFNARMEALNDLYDLDEEDSKIVASELADLDETEESFAGYQEKLAKVWKHKNKEFIAAEQKAFEDRVAQEVEKRLSESTATSEEEKEEVSQETSEASTAEETESEESDEVADALENLEVEEAAVVNNNESSSEGDSLRERFAKTFKESVKISY